MKSVYPHIIPNIEDWPIYQISKNRSEFVSNLNDFTYERMMALHSHEIEQFLAKTIYLEKIRSKRKPWKVDPPNEPEYWKSLETEFSAAGESDNKEELYDELLKRIINRYSEEITGTFNPKTFKFARKFLISFFKRLLNTAAGKNHRRIWGNKYQLYDKVKVVGYVDEIRSLFEKGVIVVVPTHFSNLDSILIGFAMDSVVGLPAFSYGAGLNLYEAELVAYFMNRLGAYKVDRRKKNPIYLECLKSMACYSLQEGVNNIFFPGGTRSRSGSIEERLKLGLLGSVVESQRRFIQKGSDKKIYVIPLILNYHFVLEGKFLIEQYLKATGKEKYIKTKDQYKSYLKIMKFIWSVFSEQSEITLSFGKPMDVLGNPIDIEGRSIGVTGEPIDLKEYFILEDELTSDEQRESVYTRMLGEKILESYYHNNIVLSSHLVAFAAFRILMKKNREVSIYDLINIPPEEFAIERSVFCSVIDQLKEGLIEWENEGKIKLSAEIRMETQDLVEHGIKNLGVYHPSKPLAIKEDIVKSEDIKLLYYYHNRLENYKLHRIIKWEKIFDKEISNPIVE